MPSVWLLSGLLLLLLTPGTQAGERDVAAGWALATKWCASCHLVGDSDVASDGAPPFAALAEDPDMTSDRLSAFLAEPHGGMRELSLSRQQIDDLIAYIESPRSDPKP